MKIRLNWTESVGYYTDVEADSKEEAKRMLHDGEVDTIEPCGYAEMQDDLEADIFCVECEQVEGAYHLPTCSKKRAIAFDCVREGDEIGGRPASESYDSIH